MIAMEFTNKKVLERKIEEIHANIFSYSESLNIWQTRKNHLDDCGKYSKFENEKWEYIQVGTHWKCGVADTQWFKKSITVTEHYAGKPLVLELIFGGDGLVTVNEEPKSAVTEFRNATFTKTRSRVFLTQKAILGETFDILAEVSMNYLDFFSFNDPKQREEEYHFSKAVLGAVDSTIENYYFDVRTTFDAMTAIENDPSCQYVVSKLRQALQKSLAAVDMDMGWEALRSSIPYASEILRKALEKIDTPAHATIQYVGHAHIDTAWLWPLKETIRKCARTGSNVLDLMNRYPNLIFAFSQPQLLAYLKEYYPLIYSGILKRIKAGQIELVGNAWVEMDTNLCSGESLIRQLLYGREFLLKETGKESDIFWMPDVFGYSWALPQIIKRSGMKYFYTSKLTNNDTNRFPHSLFLWKGIDGTKILSYMQRKNYNGVYTPSEMHELYKEFDQKDVSDDLLMTFGYGDGGGGPTYEMMERANRLKCFPGLQKSEITSALSFFEKVSQNQQELPVWFDEMYFENHRGTYTSQANNKKNNRKAELLFRQAEILASIANDVADLEYPMEKVRAGYEIILRNQFHDIIPGSSIKDVYEDSAKEYETIFQIGTSIQESAIASLLKKIPHSENSVIVFNTLSWERSEYVTVEVPWDNSQNCVVLDADNRIKNTLCQSKKNGMRVMFETGPIPPMGYAVYKLEARPAENHGGVTVSKSHMENEFFRLDFDTNGNISTLYDKISQRHILDKTKPSNMLQVFEDKPFIESAWNINLEYQNKMWELAGPPIAFEIMENSPVRAVVRIKRVFNQSTITQDIVMYSNSRRIDFHTVVDWNEREKMLKVAFFPDVLSTKATYEIQFGSIERPTHWNTSYDKSKFEVCGHKWADLSEGGYGVSLLNDCKYGYDIKDNSMRLTLLRSPVMPDPYGDIGTHEFVYSLFPHEGDWRTGKTVHKGYELNVPLTAVFVKDQNTGNLPTSFFWVDRDNVVLDTVKKAQNSDGIIVRMYESCGMRGKVTLGWNTKEQAVFECNLMEDNEAQLFPSDKTISFEIKPYEIKTFRLK